MSDRLWLKHETLSWKHSFKGFMICDSHEQTSADCLVGVFNTRLTHNHVQMLIFWLCRSSVFLMATSSSTLWGTSPTGSRKPDMWKTVKKMFCSLKLTCFIVPTDLCSSKCYLLGVQVWCLHWRIRCSSWRSCGRTLCQGKTPWVTPSSTTTKWVSAFRSFK